MDAAQALAEIQADIEAGRDLDEKLVHAVLRERRESALTDLFELFLHSRESNAGVLRGILVRKRAWRHVSEVEERLARAVASNRNHAFRYEAIELLWEPDTAAAGAALAALAIDESLPVDVRGFALERLTFVKSQPGLARVTALPLLASVEPELRFWACYALMGDGTPADVPALELLTSDASETTFGSVGSEASAAIGAITSRHT